MNLISWYNFSVDVLNSLLEFSSDSFTFSKDLLISFEGEGHTQRESVTTSVKTIRDLNVFLKCHLILPE